MATHDSVLPGLRYGKLFDEIKPAFEQWIRIGAADDTAEDEARFSEFLCYNRRRNGPFYGGSGLEAWRLSDGQASFWG
jgi:hypothetical protein